MSDVTKRTFEIEWPSNLGPMWMNRDNLMACLVAHCPNTKFKVMDVTSPETEADPECGDD